MPRSVGSQLRFTVTGVFASTRPSGVLTRTNRRLLKPCTSPSPSSVTAATWMPSCESSTLATPSTRSPAASTALMRAVTVTRPTRSAGTAGNGTSKRPAAVATTAAGSLSGVHSGDGGHSPSTLHWRARRAAETGAPEL